MTCVDESSAALSDQLELHRRMWVLRLLGMAIAELRGDDMIAGSPPVGFGQEAVAVGAGAALREGDVAIATRGPYADLVGLGARLGPTIAPMMGRIGADGGLPAPAPAVKRSPLLAVGHAYLQWLDDAGRVTLCVVADSEVDSADFDQAAKLAVCRRLPVVILVEDIRGACSARRNGCGRETRLYRTAAGYGMPGVSVDGHDVAAVRDRVAQAVERARTGGGPTLIHAITHRTDLCAPDRADDGDRDGRFVDPLIVAGGRGGGGRPPPPPPGGGGAGAAPPPPAGPVFG
ncbi:thiamine pyrophosphate-dependent enzyme, partial [Mycobacterium shinjukuense]|uniref:thiamine pyrophosphate-dependent enzyme n=1 Tax=Mycobacterium shinjukuense TaxID=398694 RepID=UPI000A0E087C